MKKVRLDWIIVLPTIASLVILGKFVVFERSFDAAFIMFDFIALCFFVVYVLVQSNRIGAMSQQAEIDKVEFTKQLEHSHSFSNRQQDLINELQGKALEVEKDAAKVQILVSQIRLLKPLKSASQRLKKILSLLAGQFEISAGIIYLLNPSTNLFEPVERYALDVATLIPSVEIGIGLGGEVVRNNEVRVLSSVPDDYIQISTGLGESKPSHLCFLPISIGGKTIGLIELASFKLPKIDGAWNELNGEIADLLAKD